MVHFLFTQQSTGDCKGEQQKSGPSDKKNII